MRANRRTVVQRQNWGLCNPAQAVKKADMNKDQIKGTARNIAGKAEEAVGKALDNKKMQSNGLKEQIVGNAEKAMGDVKQGVKNVSDAVKQASK
jgi:uncharacterized protein YjbJ (UPF0337 family)